MHCVAVFSFIVIALTYMVKDCYASFVLIPSDQVYLVVFVKLNLQ